MRSSSVFLFAAVLSPVLGAVLGATPIAPKVAVIALYEQGEVTGDEPGEYQFWVEREGLDTIIPFPMGPYDLRMNDAGLLGVCVGPGVTNAGATFTALALDERFDFSKTYWIIAGIAGGDPADSTIGTAAWARWVIDGDLSKAIDSREAPENWPYGIFPMNSKAPNELGDGYWYKMAFPLNPELVAWAYELSKDVEIPDHPEVAAFRALYEGMPVATGAPRVILGESLGSNTYWHGEVLTQWANDWVSLFTEGRGNFVMTNVEDNGILRVMDRLDANGYIDRDRVLVLRCASNFSHQPPGKDADWSLTAPYPANGRTALEACYRVAQPVVDALLEDWELHADAIPGAPVAW
jgi:purine nucleoside permease